MPQLGAPRRRHHAPLLGSARGQCLNVLAGDPPGHRIPSLLAQSSMYAEHAPTRSRRRRAVPAIPRRDLRERTVAPGSGTLRLGWRSDVGTRQLSPSTTRHGIGPERSCAAARPGGVSHLASGVWRLASAVSSADHLHPVTALFCCVDAYSVIAPTELPPHRTRFPGRHHRGAAQPRLGPLLPRTRGSHRCTEGRSPCPRIQGSPRGACRSPGPRRTRRAGSPSYRSGHDASRDTAASPCARRRAPVEASCVDGGRCAGMRIPWGPPRRGPRA